ncbi:glycosyltransferase [Candidatus Saccharibacteria bacterium]|nr:glycosyltransferase [Candidatus Saccharibacteria bacterium]
MKEDVFLTVGITAHAEGVLAHKTIMSVFAALEELDTKKYPYEIIVHIDNGDFETEKYFAQYEDDKRFRIIRSHFKDLGMSRNCIARNARGKYVSFLDADDMLSSNWYINAIKRMEESESTIMVHPNVQFNFGAGTRLEFTMRSDSFNKFEDAIISAGVNRWCSAIMGKRETFLEYPYMETRNGYGYEDYNLNTNTVGHGIKHMVAPDTVMFYRQKAEGSLLASSNTEHVIQPYVSLLDIDFMKSVPESEVEKVKAKTVLAQRRSKIVKIYYKIRGNEKINYFIIPVAKLTKKILRIGVSKQPKAKVPKFMLEEWKKINKIEASLYPTKSALDEIFQAKSDDYDVGMAYYELVKNIPKMPDFVFVVPWVRVGGADKVLENYLRSIERHHPNSAVAVITTMPGKNSQKSKLPDNAYLVDFGNVAYPLWPQIREMLFSRLITQLKCKRVHIINSEFGYSWVATHKKFAENECKFDVSIFSTTNKYTPGMGTYANPFLVDIYNVVNKIYTDNENLIEELKAKEGFSEDKMKVVYQPTNGEVRQFVARNRDCKFRILWASRIDHEKNPELLLEIAKKLNPDDYMIDVYGEFGEDYNKMFFSGIKNLSYKGKFTDFGKISDGYDAFLYTSTRDGLPNVILEATMAGLPIVASRIGGVGDFIIDGETGVGVKDILDVDRYVSGIEQIAKHPKVTKKYVEKAQQLLGKRHSWKKFYTDTKEMFDVE